MKRVLIFSIVIVGGLMVVFLLTKNSSSHSQQSVAAENNAGPAGAKTEDSQPKGPRGINVNTAQMVNNVTWREKLAIVQGDINELFGSSGDDSLKALQDFAESISTADLPAALRELHALQENKPTSAGRDLEMRLLKRWAENDGPLAAAWANEITGADRQEALSAAASIWARKDFSAAARWAEQLPPGNDRQDTLKSVVSESLYANPTDTLKVAAELPPDSERDELIARAAGVWAATAPADAAAWVKQLADDRARTAAIAAIAIAWADRDPIAAGNLAVNSLPPGKTQQNAVFAVLRRWSLQDKTAAKSWVAQFPSGELRTVAMESLANDSKRLSAVVPTD